MSQHQLQKGCQVGGVILRAPGAVKKMFPYMTMLGDSGDEIEYL